MRLLFVFLFLAISNVFGQSSAYKKMLANYYNDFPTISVESAKSKIGQSGVYFLDTREKKEFLVSHIKTAKWVGYDHFSMKEVKSIPKDAQIIVYCSIGARSQNIGERLAKAGYKNVQNLYGGLFHWSNTGLPLVDASGKKTTSIHGYSKDWGKWVTNGHVVY